MVPSRRSAVALAGCSTLVVAACGGGGSATESTTPLMATTTIWADITSQIVCGDPVPALVPAGADPHTFEPSLRDRSRLDSATAVIANGGGLEGSLVDLLDVAASNGADVVEMMPLARPVSDDPHVWQDPTRVSDVIDDIAAMAVDAGFDADTVAACADDYRTELAALDAEIAGLLAPLPVENRRMVTSHDSLEYFADRYGLDIVGTVIPSTNTLAESNAADLAALAGQIETLGVPAVFTEQLESSTDADRLADRLGVEVVPLVTDALTSDPATDTYVEMMRSNAAAIAEALAP